MSIKDNLSNLIVANGYDINNDEVKNALLSLAGSNIINLPLDKKHIAIRTLSLNEYEKYIKNGTADGAISKYNINVYNYIITPTNIKVVSSPGNTSGSQMSIVSYDITQSGKYRYCKYTASSIGEVSCNNQNEKAICMLQNDVNIQCVASDNHGGRAIHMVILLLKIFHINI